MASLPGRIQHGFLTVLMFVSQAGGGFAPRGNARTLTAVGKS